MDYNWAHRILHRRAYTGLYSWSGIEIEEGVPSIIDDVTSERIQNVMLKKTRKGDGWYPTGYRKALLRPLRHVDVWSAGRGKSGRRYRYNGCKEDGKRGR